MVENQSFDVIVIGSGIGGLSAAAILAKYNSKKVLVLEKHFTLGGQTHEFSRDKFTWDVGVHYIGEMNPKNFPRQLFDYITNNRLEWSKMPYVFDKYIYPDLIFEAPANEIEYREKLIALFPNEKTAIKQYFRDIKKVMSWYVWNLYAEILPQPIASIIKLACRKKKKLACSTVKNYLDDHFKEQRLKALLTSLWLDYGVPPEKSAFFMHAATFNHYLTGAFYPQGGASSIAKSIAPTITEKGGVLLTNHEVTNLIIENREVRGVHARYQNGAEFKEVSFYAPIVISDIGAAESYQRFLPDVPPPTCTREQGLSCVLAFIGFKSDPSILGLHGENYFIINSYDHDTIAKKSSTSVLKGQPSYCFLSFPSLKNKYAQAHTAEIMAMADINDFLPYADKPWHNRRTEYYDLKEKITEGLLNYVEKTIPGFRNLIEYVELATPLTLQNFTSKKDGLMYGTPASQARFEEPASILTPLKNFYLTGTDTSTPGLVGGAFGGLLCTAKLNSLADRFKLFTAIMNSNKTSSRTNDITLPSSITPSQKRKSMPGELDAELISKTNLSSTFWALKFALSNQVSYVAGQHIYLCVAPSVWRPYSIANIQGSELTLIIDVKPGGPGSQFTLQSPIGHKTIIKVPMGSFQVSQQHHVDKIFIATGSGIVPFISMIQKLSTSFSGNSIKLIWGIREESHDFSAIYLGDLIGSPPFEKTLCITGTNPSAGSFQGRVTKWLQYQRLDFSKTEFYLCGNPNMILDAHSFLRGKYAKFIFYEM